MSIKLITLIQYQDVRICAKKCLFVCPKMLRKSVRFSQTRGTISPYFLFLKVGSPVKDELNVALNKVQSSEVLADVCMYVLCWYARETL